MVDSPKRPKLILPSLTREQVEILLSTAKPVRDRAIIAPFGSLTEGYLKEWLTEYQPGVDEAVWDIGFWGIKGMLRDLSLETGLACNPHTFRRTFACLLRKAGVDIMTIKDLGR